MDAEPRNLIAPLVSLLIAVLLHLLLLPLFVLMLTSDPVISREASPPKIDRPLPVRAPKVELGTDDAKQASVAFIPYEAFEELLAPKSTTEQPALQATDVDPIDEAPPELDPTPPDLQATPTEPLPPAPQTPDAQPDATAKPAPDVGDPQEQTGAIPLQFEGPKSAEKHAPEPTDAAAPTPNPEAQEQPQPARPPAKPSDAKPTVAAPSDRESPPTTVKLDSDKIRPGKVITGPGIELKTFAPRISAVAYSSVLPVNPIVDITFDNTGQVRNVVLKRSSGEDNVDGPVVAAIFRWKASGERIEQAKGPIVVEGLKILLVKER